MKPINIYRTAKLLIDQHGEDTAIEAAIQADRCLDSGDLDGVSVWKGVIHIIGEISTTSSKGPTHEKVIAQSGVLAPESSGDQISLCSLESIFEPFYGYHFGQVVEAA